jgi:hypothetical protein
MSSPPEPASLGDLPNTLCTIRATEGFLALLLRTARTGTSAK